MPRDTHGTGAGGGLPERCDARLLPRILIVVHEQIDQGIELLEAVTVVQILGYGRSEQRRTRIVGDVDRHARVRQDRRGLGNPRTEIVRPQPPVDQRQIGAFTRSMPAGSKSPTRWHFTQ